VTPRKRTVLFRSTPWREQVSTDIDVGVHNATGAEELLITSGHNFTDLGKTNRDVGGDFLVRKNSYAEWVDSDVTSGDTYLGERFTNTNNPNVGAYSYKGKFYAAVANVVPSTFPVAPYSTAPQLDAYGTTAIARVLPTNPLADLATFIGELREGIPHLAGGDFFRGRTEQLRGIGGAHLGYEFGVKPLVNDLRKFGRSVVDSDEFIRQYERNSGKRLKRRYEFPEIKSVSVLTEADKQPQPVTFTNLYNGTAYKGTRTRERSITINRWFSGCFTYYLSDSSDSRKRYTQLANKLFGVRLTPEVIWNLTPWSWAVDWFGNMGDVLHNVSAFQHDGLVMPYGYVMEQVTISDTYRLTGLRFKSYPKFNGALCQTFTTTVKQRRKANPYGFGLDLGSLTSRQWSIIGALGLTRSFRQF
jgi:hypothetical protein